MGKVRTKKEVKKKSLSSSGGNTDTLLKNTVGKLESKIGAISLGPPRSKILKKSASSSSSGLVSSNFASRITVLSKEKKKVRFCQNILAEELKEQKASSSENAKHYFKVIHPSAIEKKIGSGAKVQGGPTTTKKTLEAIIPDPEVLMTTSTRALRKIIKNSTNKKKTVSKARKELFKKKLDLLKAKREEIVKAKQRQQTVIVGDMHPMLQSLPALTSDIDDRPETELVAKNASEEKSKCVPNKTKFSVKKTQKAILDSLKFFEASGVSAGIGVTNP